MYLLLVVAASLAASAAQSPSQAYERNKEYLYEYETQALTGMPQGSTIYSGMKLKCEVRIQFRSRSSVTLQMDRISLSKINDPIESVNPTQQQVPENLFRPLTGSDADQMTKDLSRPINFLYVRGNVREIKQEADDPEWSVNVKKGLLSILEVNMDKRKQLEQSSSIPRVLRPQSSNEESMYKVMEPSIAGECETLYKVTPRTSSSGDPVMYITKVRNYDNCLDRPMYFASMFHGKKCAKCVKEWSDPLRSASQVMYTIRGNTRMFQIQSAIAESQHVFTPYSNKGGNVATYLNQTLNLLKVLDVKDSLSQPSSPRTVRSGLQFKSREIESRDDSSSSTQKSPSSNQSPAPEVPSQQSQKSGNQAKERIRKLLKMLETFMKPTIQEEAGPLLMSLLEEIRKADAESLRAVFRETAQSASSDSKKFKMLMDLLPSAGTAPATEILVDAIKNNQITKPQATIALNILSLSARPEVLVAKTLMELTQSTQVSQNRMLKRAAFLCLGAVAGKLREEEHRRSREMSRQEEIVNTLMSTVSNSQSRKKLKSKRRDMGDRKRKQQSIYTRIRQEIVKEIQSLMKSTDTDDKILSFKTAGNSGLREMIPSVRTHIEDKSQPQMLRAQAIYSLRKLTTQHSQDIQSILLARYFDRTEKEEVRISSYFVLASTNPSRQLLEMIAHSLHTETNPHVGTFVYTHLEQMSNSTYPCLMSWAKNATFALRFAKKFSPMFQYSRFHQFSGYSDRVKMGAAAELGIITSPEEFIPRAGTVHLSTHVLGSSVNFAEIGFNTEGLQTLISKMVGPLGELTKGKSVMDVLKQRVRRSSKSQQNQSDPISQIHQQLKVSPRTSPEPKGHVYIKMMGNELQYFSLDRTVVETLLKEGKILMSLTEQKMKSGIDVDIHRSLMPLDADTMIPTESGLPLRLRLRGTAAVKVTGKFKVSGVPSLFEINRPGKPARELGLDLELSPSVLVDIRGEMEMDAEYFKAGVSIKSMAHVETPLSFSTTYNLHTAKLITKVNIEKLNEKVAKLEISPSTYFKENPSDITKYPRPIETQCIRAAEGAKAKPVSITFGKCSLGLEVGVSGQAVVSDFEMNVPYYPMIGKQELFITLSPGINPQKYMEFQLQLMAPKQKSAQQQPTSDRTMTSGGGIISKIASYISLFSSGQSDQIPSSSSQPSPPPKDIKSTDSSLSTLIQHLKEPQSVQSGRAIVSHNNSIGILMNVIGIDESRSIKRHLQLCMAAGLDMSSRVTSILMSLNRSPVPEMETKPWKMDIAINLNLPTRLVNPSELLSESYQKELEKQIEVHIRRHGEAEYKRLINREVPNQQIRVLQTLLSSTGTHQIIDEVVNTEMSKSEESSPSSEEKVIKLIREQKHLLKEVTNIRRRSSDPLKLQRVKSTLSSVMKWSEKVKKHLESESRSVPSSERSDTLRKYSALLQQIIEQRLEESVLSSMRALSSKDQQYIKKSLETSRESLRKILQQQSSSQSSQSSSQSPSVPEVQSEGSSQQSPQQQESKQSEESQQTDSSKSQSRQLDSQSPSVSDVNSKGAQESPKQLHQQQQSDKSRQQSEQSQQLEQQSQQSRQSQQSEQSQQPEQQSQQSRQSQQQSEQLQQPEQQSQQSRQSQQQSEQSQQRQEQQRTLQQPQHSRSHSLSQSSSQSSLSKSLSNLLQCQREAIQELSKMKESDGVKNIDQKKIKEAIRVAKEVNEKVLQEASISSPQSIQKERAKVLKSVIQQQQITKCLEQRIKRPQSKPQQPKEVQEMRTLLQQLKRENAQMSKVVAISTQHEKEREEAKRKHSQSEQSTLESLRRVQLSQVIAAQQLAAESSSSAKPKADDVQPMQRVQQCMTILDQTGTQIVSLIKQRSVKQSPLDVITKLVEVTQMQHNLLGLLAERAREEQVQSVSRSEARDTRIEKLEEKAETEKLEYLQIIINILQSISSKRSVSTLSRSDNQRLQMVHNKIGIIRSMQVKIERRVRDIKKDQDNSAKKPDPTTITELAAKCKSIQDEIEKVESNIRSNQLHQKVDDTTEEPWRRIEVQKQIVEKVKELVPKSAMSPQEKQSIQASLKTQEKRLEELQRRVQELKNEESQQRNSSSQQSQSIQSSRNRPSQQDKLQDRKAQQSGDDSRSSRKSNVKSEQISRRPKQKESAKQRSEKSINNQQTESQSLQQPSAIDSQQSSDQSESQKQPNGQQSDRSQNTQKQRAMRRVKSSALGDLDAETDREICISIKAQYGPEGEKKKFFDIQILGTPSLEQLLWERAQKSPLERSSITKTYLREKRDGSEEVTSAYLGLNSEMNMIRHLHVRVHYEREEIPRSVEEFAWWTHEAMKAIMYRHLFTKYPHSFRPKDRMEVLLNFRRNNRQFDAELKLPEESNFLRGISMPYFGPFLFESVRGIRDGLHRPLQKTLSAITSRLPGQCEVKHNQIRTMDGKEYRVPDTKNCEVILSMDCSSAKRFAIKYKKDSSNPSKRSVEVHIEGKRIEIIPVNSSLEIRVDGKKHDIPAESSISVKAVSSLHSSEPSRIEISRQQNSVSISASQKGVHVTSDGHKISIKMTPFYYSQVCGLCGNFDGKQGNEYQSPQRVDRSDPSCFVLDYLIPSSKCDTGSVQKECHLHQNSSSPSRCQLKPETILRTRLNKDISQLCFSQSPVKSCPSHCQQRDPKSKAVPMVCYKHESVKAQALKKASYKGPVAELKSHQANYTEYVQEPTSCGEM